MNFFENLNRHLEKGWKLTDASCPICNSSIVYNPTDKNMFCLKCNLPVQIQKSVDVQESSDDEETDLPVEQENYQWQPNNPPANQIKAKPDVSKLLGDLLLRGWTMLDENCPQCYIAPLMRSQQMEKKCVNCEYTPNQQAAPKPEEQKVVKQIPSNVPSSVASQVNTSKKVVEKSQDVRETFMDMMAKLTHHYNGVVDQKIQENDNSALEQIIKGPLQEMAEIMTKMNELKN